MSAETLLARLDGVRRTGEARWLAKCPKHDDRRASLSVREKPDGIVLVRCFAECAAYDIVTAVGLDLSVLFPPRTIKHAPRERMPFAPLDVLRAVAFEALIVQVAAANIAHGRPLSDADRARLLTAAARLQRAVEACDGD